MHGVAPRPLVLAHALGHYVPLCLNLREDYWDWLKQLFPDNIAIHEAFKYVQPTSHVAFDAVGNIGPFLPRCSASHLHHPLAERAHSPPPCCVSVQDVWGRAGL